MWRFLKPQNVWPQLPAKLGSFWGGWAYRYTMVYIFRPIEHLGFRDFPSNLAMLVWTPMIGSRSTYHPTWKAGRGKSRWKKTSFL